ncbi:MAG: helix-turn-helix transcriptional regulator [Clostridia bacterium]|nr:helix-turn-helix transcriptional regulator [Clostridia bacterium]
METIDERIKNIRKLNNLTLEQFADRILCSVRTVQRYEKRSIITRCL